MAIATGSCACRGVMFEVTGPLRAVIACHCEQCRKTSGHFVAATATRRAYLTISKDESLSWFTAIEGFRRGFCNHCGSSLFFEKLDEDRISIAAGSLDKGHLELSIAAHIYVDECGSYYELMDSADKHDKGDHNVPTPR